MQRLLDNIDQGAYNVNQLAHELMPGVPLLDLDITLLPGPAGVSELSRVGLPCVLENRHTSLTGLCFTPENRHTSRMGLCCIPGNRHVSRMGIELARGYSVRGNDDAHRLECPPRQRRLFIATDMGTV